MRARPSRHDECDWLFELHRSEGPEIGLDLERQFKTLHDRAQVLLAICGVLISASVIITTGRRVGGSTHAVHDIAGWLLALAGFSDIAATSVIVAGVLSIRWLTQLPGEDLRTWVMRAIAHRDTKTRAYRVALRLVLLSMLFYQAAVLIVVLQL